MRTSLFLAKALKVTERHAIHLLSGRRSFTPEKAEELENQLGVPRLQLLYISERHGKSLREIVEEYRKFADSPPADSAAPPEVGALFRRGTAWACGLTPEK